MDAAGLAAPGRQDVDPGAARGPVASTGLRGPLEQRPRRFAADILVGDLGGRFDVPGGCVAAGRGSGSPPLRRRISPVAMTLVLTEFRLLRPEAEPSGRFFLLFST